MLEREDSIEDDGVRVKEHVVGSILCSRPSSSSFKHSIVGARSHST